MHRHTGKVEALVGANPTDFHESDSVGLILYGFRFSQPTVLFSSSLRQNLSLISSK